MSNGLKNLAMDRGEGGGYVQNPLYGGSFATSSGAAEPFVLPGELIQAAPLRILEPSPNRTAPACDHFGACGGCHYQHAAYPAQLDLKRTILTNLLTESGLTHLPKIQTESGPEWNYRNRIRLRIEPDATGRFQAGYSLRGTNDFLPIHMCPIAAPLLWRAAHTILTLANSDPVIRKWLLLTAELELLTTPDESKLQLQFYLRTTSAARQHAAEFPAFCDHLAAAIRVPHPRGARVGSSEGLAETTQLTGASATLDPELNRRARRAWSGTTWGAAGLNYPAAGRQYWLPRGAFFQVNRFLIDHLVELVTAGKSGPLAWDLYAGVGLFTRALAETFAQVVAVEGAEPAVQSLQSAATGKGIEPIHSATLDFLRAREHQRERPSLIVLDPPRAGLGLEAAQILARIAAPTVVYVSCDPTTLTRDLTILTAAYKIDSIHLIDLFPQTFHIETIVHLTRRGVT
jgi:23S rRNA (uracil1939-C5)-methyltransferase